METLQRKVTISISLPEMLRDGAKQAAFDDNRSVSSLISGLLQAYLEKEEYLHRHYCPLRGGHYERNPQIHLKFPPP